MSLNRHITCRRWSLVWLACLVTLHSAPATSVVTLEARELDAYREWLHRLAADTAADPTDTLGQDPAVAMFAPDVEEPGSTLQPGYRRLAASRGLLRLERAQALPGARRELTATQSLAAARECRRLAEHVNALRWCRDAAELDTSGVLSGEIQREALVSAIAVDDSLAIVRSLLNTLGASDLSGRESELVLAYRYFLVRADRDRLALLDAKVSGQGERLSIRVRCWQAFAAAQRQQWGEAICLLRELLRRGDPERVLTAAERTWVAVALPDLLFLFDQRTDASELYQAIEGSGLKSGQAWSSYQLANLDLLAGRYEAAQARYAALCPLAGTWPWRSRACALAAVADTLSMLVKESGRHEADPVAVP